MIYLFTSFFAKLKLEMFIGDGNGARASCTENSDSGEIYIFG